MMDVRTPDIVTLQALRQTAKSRLTHNQVEAGLVVGGLFEGSSAAAMMLGAAATQIAFESMVTIIGNERFLLIITVPRVQDLDLAEDLLFWLENEGAEIHTNIK